MYRAAYALKQTICGGACASERCGRPANYAAPYLLRSMYLLNIPLVLLYLSGHFAGRHKRLNEKTTATSGPNAILHGTSAGITSGLIFIILVGLSGKYLGSFLGIVHTHDIFGSVLGSLGFVLAFIGWFFAGVILGSIGGLFGDSLAHKQLKKA